MSANGFPGMVVGIWAQGKAYVKAFGPADTSANTPMSLDDSFRIASITKTFTATVILQLAQQGKLALTDPLSKYEPQIPNASKITIRELLNHTSGLQTNSPKIIRQFVQHPMTPISPQQVIAADVALPPLSPPGKAFHYSDSGFAILGEVAQKVTGEPIGTLIERQILNPVGLHHTAYPPGGTMPSPFAHGYFVRKGGQKVDTSGWDFSYTSSAGSMTSTIGDLYMWAPVLATGKGILSPATQRQRLSSPVNAGAPGFSYGLGIAEIGDFLGHDGEVNGYNSIMLYSPTEHVTLVALGNTSPSLNKPSDPLGETIVLVAELYKTVFGKPISGIGSATTTG
jgi:D-alanyl-D-alanine carboxypeptidase